MARRLRLQFPGAIYHVINRGNYQHAVFASAGAARAFERTLGEAAARHRWRVHAYVVLSNHFHVALETPEPNLVEGMHWLLTTFVTRHNRFRRRQGHLFQGRYKSLLIQDAAHLSRVADYIHLNPVRAGLVPAAHLAEFRPSSLWHFARPPAPSWLVATSSQSSSEAGSDELSPAILLGRLSEVANQSCADDRMSPGALSTGWAIGTAGWRKALARDHAHLALAPEMVADEIAELKRDQWQRELEVGLGVLGKTLQDAKVEAKSVAWKVALARRLREAANAPYGWIAEVLEMGAASSVRAYVSQTSD